MAVTTIISEPNVELLAAYRPLNYTVWVSGALSDRPAAISVQVKVAGADLGDPIPIEAKESFSSAVETTSIFEFNISEKVQTFFSTADFWPEVASPTPIVSPSLQALVSVEITTSYPDADGVLQVDTATIVSSQEVPVLNAYRREVEGSDLREYDSVTTSQQNPTQVRFLTRKPDRTLVSLDDSEWLGLWTKGLFSLRILSFDWDGVQQADGSILTGVTLFGADELSILPVGPANINAIDPGDWMPNTGPVVIDSDTKYYIVQAGWTCPDGSYYNLSEIRRYYLVPNGCRSHRVHFLNSFGVPESFSIFNNKIEEFIVTSENYTSPVPREFGLLDGGERRVQSSGVVSIKSPLGNVRLKDRLWLAREFALSFDTRIEIDGAFIPVVVRDGNFPIEDSTAAAPSITFTLDYAKRTSSQRS